MSDESNLRKNKNPYTQVPNELITDSKLSLNARAVYAFMLSKPDNWNFTLKSMTKQLGSTEHSVRNAMTELKVSGWVSYKKFPDGKGEYYLQETKPNDATPNVVTRNMRETTRISNTDLNSNTNKEKDICLSSDSELPLNIPTIQKEKPTKEKVKVDFFALLDIFNRLTGQKKRIVSQKAKDQIMQRLAEGYSKDDFIAAIKNCYDDPHHQKTGHTYLTLEFISREKILERFHYVKPASQKRETGSL